MSSSVSPVWYRDFFTELPNEFWRRAVPPQSTTADVDFIERKLGLKPGCRIADVPCGSGRHTLALAARGHHVTGVDLSTEAIAYARRAAADVQLDIELIEADMRELPRDRSFDAAVCMGNSFGYLDITGTREFLAALAAAVRPGGGLLIDFNATAESILPCYTGEPRTIQTGDISVVGSSEYDLAGSRLISSYHYTRGEQELRTTAIHHVYTSAHLGQLLGDAGFTDVRRYGGPRDEPYELGSGRLLLTASRTASLCQSPGWLSLKDR